MCIKRKIVSRVKGVQYPNTRVQNLKSKNEKIATHILFYTHVSIEDFLSPLAKLSDELFTLGGIIYGYGAALKRV